MASASRKPWTIENVKFMLCSLLHQLDNPDSKHMEKRTTPNNRQFSVLKSNAESVYGIMGTWDTCQERLDEFLVEDELNEESTTENEELKSQIRIFSRALDKLESNAQTTIRPTRSTISNTSIDLPPVPTHTPMISNTTKSNTTKSNTNLNLPPVPKHKPTINVNSSSNTSRELEYQANLANLFYLIDDLKTNTQFNKIITGYATSVPIRGLWLSIKNVEGYTRDIPTLKKFFTLLNGDPNLTGKLTTYQKGLIQEIKKSNVGLIYSGGSRRTKRGTRRARRTRIRRTRTRRVYKN